MLAICCLVANQSGVLGRFRGDTPISEDAMLGFLRVLPLDLSKDELLVYPLKDDCLGFTDPQAMKLVSLDKGIHFYCSWQQGHWKDWKKRYEPRFHHFMVGPVERVEPELLQEIRREEQGAPREIRFQLPRSDREMAYWLISD